MAIVASAASPVISILTLLPVRRKFGYFYYSTKYFDNMRVKKRELEGAANDMRNRKEDNNVRNIMVPQHVPSWLEQAEEIFGKVDSISAGGNGYLHIKRRYKAGKRCYKVIKDIERLMIERSHMEWIDVEIPLGIVSSAIPQVPQDVSQNIINPNEQIPSGMASLATPQVLQDVPPNIINSNEQIPPGMASLATPQVLQDVPQTIIKSRQLIFERALQLLEPRNPTLMVALCGMGGIGKTTMMEDLKKVVENKKLFDRVVPVVMGKSTDPIAFQDAIAQYTGEKLSETTKEARADRLRKRLLGMSQDGKKKILIILDDLWNIVDLKDIGLASPWPKGFKLFLTSRYETLCCQMGVEVSSILNILPLKEPEAIQLFWETMGLSDGDADHELHKVGENIVKRCGGLPMAINTIALSLKGKIKDAWKLTLLRLRRHDLQDLQDLQGRYDVVHHIFKISYEGLPLDDKEIFILSGIFPDDFNIPLEDLMRYAWGLKLFDNVHSLFEARLRTNTSIHNLIRANLLVESDRKGCVKMHDLARSFVLSNISEFKQASVINHSDMSEWPKQDTGESCERILLNCKGMSGFPRHFDYPNLKLLKLMMNEKEPLKFPDDFYARMKQLEVISYRSIPLSSLAISLQYSTSLRMLSFHSCSFEGDLSYLGHLSNLELLSFVNCHIECLPSTMGNLGKLKLLDLTGCGRYRIGDGVFQKLDNLEELYMRNFENKVMSFTKDNCKGLEMVLVKLIALEVEFFERITQLNNVSLKNLERFSISVGCHLDPIYDNDVYSYENTLRLLCSVKEVRASEINKLFEKTEKLHLQVKDMIYLEDILIHPSQYSFSKLKHLSFQMCGNLTYLFTVNVASTLTNLESLTVRYCDVLASLIHDDGNNGVEVIKFLKLKRLELHNLPMFEGLCDNINIVMEFPQLMWLILEDLPNITCIFASSNNISETTIPLLNKEVVFPKLEEIKILRMCLNEIWGCEEEDDRTPVLKVIEVDECDNIQSLFPINPMPLLSHLEVLVVQNSHSIQVLFDIDSECVGQVNSSLRSIRAVGLPTLRELWRIKDNSGLLIRNFQALEFIQIIHCESFRNIVTPTTIKLDMGALIDITIDLSGEKWGANSRSVHQENDILEASDSHPIVAVPSSFIHTLHNLSNVKLCTLEQVEVIFDIHVPSVGIVTPQPFLLPRLSDIKMSDMNCMTHLWRCNWRKFLMLHNPQQKSSFQNLTTIYMEKCKTIEYLFSPLMATLLSNLKKIHVENCNRFQEVVSNRDDEDDILKGTTNVRFRSLRSIILGKLPNLRGFFFGFSGKNELQLPLLDELVIERCPQMMAFSSLPLRAPKLEYIHINAGKYNSSFFMTTTTLPRAPSQSLNNTNSSTTISEEFLSYSRSLIEMNARGGWESRVFFLYDELPQLLNLEKLYARDCVSVLEVFDIGTEVRCSSSSQISVVELPKLSDVCLQYLESLKYIWMSNGRRTILEFPNLAKLSISSCNQLEHVFTCSMVGSLLQLKELSIRWCQNMEVIVKEDQEEEEEEGGDIGKVNEPIRLPCLKSLELGNLDSLKGFCLGNADYSFPSLESMSIKRCKSITTFTKGDLFVPELKVMETRLGTINLAEEQDINSFIITKTQEGFDL